MNSKIFIYSLLVAIIMLLFSCRTDIDTVEECSGVPIVYAIFNDKDAVHYVRINKSYNGNQSAYEMGKHPDSILFNVDLDVRVIVFNKKDAVVETLKFEKKNFPKDSVNSQGEVVFSDKKHYVYEYKGKLPMVNTTIQKEEEYIYKLEIKLNNEIIAWSTTKAMQGFRFEKPKEPSGTVAFQNNNYGVAWTPGNYCGAVRTELTFHYYEHTTDDKYYVRKIKTLSSGIIIGTGYPFNGQIIIDEIKNQIQKDKTPNVDKRFLGYVEVEYFAANIDFTEQIILQGATENLNFDGTPMTNIKGGFGVFGTKTSGKFEAYVSTKGDGHDKFFLGQMKIPPYLFQYQMAYESLPDSLKPKK